MDSSLERLSERLAAAQDEQAVAAAVLDSAPALASCVGYYALISSASPPVPDRRLAIQMKGAPAGFVEHYERYGRAGDPLLARVASSHCPAFLDLASLRSTRDSSAGEAARRFRYHIEQYPQIQHCLLSPIVVGGELAATLNFARTDNRRFCATDLGTAAAMSLHVSSRLAALRRPQTALPTWDGVLTPRDLEVADMVVLGLTNAEAGRALGISVNAVKKHLSQMFVKLGVTSRAELVRVLLLGPTEWVPDAVGDGGFARKSAVA